MCWKRKSKNFKVVTRNTTEVAVEIGIVTVEIETEKEEAVVEAIIEVVETRTKETKETIITGIAGIEEVGAKKRTVDPSIVHTKRERREKRKIPGQGHVGSWIKRS